MSTKLKQSQTNHRKVKNVDIVIDLLIPQKACGATESNWKTVKSLQKTEKHSSRNDVNPA